jgi:peptidoglycan/xylan/chitin deacetylase (PgdA/CDA1 family)
MSEGPKRATTFPDLIGRLACWRNLGRKTLSAINAAFVTLPVDRDWVFFPLYHFIVDDERRGFDAHLRYMRRHGDFISMDNAVDALKNPGGIGGRYFCVTFDDGVKNCVTNALPILVERRAPAAFFIATEYVGLRLETDWERIRPFPQPYTGFRGAFDFVTWDDCREMHAAGMTIGAHTRHHRRLQSMSEAECDDELRGSKARIEAELQAPCVHFAAPWGVPGADFDPQVHPARARTIGFKSFLTTRPGANQSHGDPFAIRRTGLRGFNWTSQVHCLFSAEAHATQKSEVSGLKSQVGRET